MKRILFWKILVGVWAMFFVISLGVWLVGWAYFEYNRAAYVGDAEEYARIQIKEASIVTRYGGRAGLNELMKTWPEYARKMLYVTSAVIEARPALKAEDPARPTPVSTTVQAPDGVWRLVYQPYWDESEFTRPWPYLNPEPRVLALQAITSLIFSAFMAWYLILPIKQLWAAREQLLYDVSHELRTPLARLRLAIDLARQDPKKVDSSLDRIDSESQRLSDMISELLTLSRADNAVATDQYFDVIELVRAVTLDARFEADHAGILIHSNLEEPVPGELPAEPEPPAVKGDAELLRRGLENVVRNALRFSERGQTVEIDVTVDKLASAYRVDIRDQGPGVPTRALTTMFEPFVRVDRASGPGFGLGLAIARRAVMAQGGAIEACNRSEGGLQVSVRVPFAPKTNLLAA